MITGCGFPASSRTRAVTVTVTVTVGRDDDRDRDRPDVASGRYGARRDEI